MKTNIDIKPRNKDEYEIIFSNENVKFSVTLPKQDLIELSNTIESAIKINYFISNALEVFKK